MSNLSDELEVTGDGLRATRVGERAGAEWLGASIYELKPGEEMVFHYHVQREELLIVLSGRRFSMLLTLLLTTAARPKSYPLRPARAQRSAQRRRKTSPGRHSRMHSERRQPGGVALAYTA